MQTTIIVEILLWVSLGGVVTYYTWRSIKRRKQEAHNRELIQTVTDLNRGTASERQLVLELLKLGYSQSDIFHDLYVERGQGWYSQSDVVLITKTGVVVFEVKDYSGWLFGKGYQTYWTQVLNFGKEKHRFYNPVLQNNAHIEAIRMRIPQLNHVPIYSVIVYYGSCEFKNVSQIPRDVEVIYSWELPRVLSDISNRSEDQYFDIEGVKSALRHFVTNGGNPEIRFLHAKNIQDKVL